VIFHSLLPPIAIAGFEFCPRFLGVIPRGQQFPQRSGVEQDAVFKVWRVAALGNARISFPTFIDQASHVTPDIAETVLDIQTYRFAGTLKVLISVSDLAQEKGRA
jgi:hypothetical protein